MILRLNNKNPIKIQKSSTFNVTSVPSARSAVSVQKKLQYL